MLVETDRCFGWERETSFADTCCTQIQIPCPLMSLSDVLDSKITNTASFFVKTTFVHIAPLTFPFLGIVLSHTLRVGREMTLVVTNDQRQIRECILFPTPPVGRGPFSAWLNHLCVARLLYSIPFWSARSANRLTRSDSV